MCVSGREDVRCSGSPVRANTAACHPRDALNVILRPEEKLLRLVDPTSGEVVPTLEEAVERAEEAETKLARLQSDWIGCVVARSRLRVLGVSSYWVPYSRSPASPPLW